MYRKTLIALDMKIQRGIAGLLACVMTSVMILVATPLTASAIQENYPVPLVNVGSGKCFAPTPQDGHLDWAGLPIQQRTCNIDSKDQQYKFVPLGYVILNSGRATWYCPGCIEVGTNGYFIQNEATGLCLDARDGATNDGSVVQQWTCRDRNARSMVWYSDPSDFPDALKLRNFNSDLCLDVSWGSSDEYAQLQQYHCTSNNAAQNFWQTWGVDKDLNGNWTDGSTRSARIYVGLGDITIDMSGFGRPNANGKVVDLSTITVTFPDDRTYTGQIQRPNTNTIRWSNGSIWTKKP
jgi:Ricin-type beta-trefoil lectin domain-like